MSNSNILEIKDFDLKTSSLIEASAGTGKTYTISYLVLRLLLGSGIKNHTAHLAGPISIDNILIVTFTEKATADLKFRVREKIRYARISISKYLENPSAFLKDNYERQLIDIIEEFEDTNDDNTVLKHAVHILKRAERDIDAAPIYTIHSFCNKALNRIYAFETGEAFESEFIIDISKYQEEAAYSVWRYLFYPKSKRQILIEDNWLYSIDGYTLFKDYNLYLEKVSLPSKDKGFLGYNLINLPKIIKDKTFTGKSAFDVLDFLVDYVVKNDFKEQIYTIFDDIFNDGTGTNILDYVYQKNAIGNNGSALNYSERCFLNSKAKPLIEHLALVYEDKSNLSLETLKLYITKLPDLEPGKEHKRFFNGSLIRNLQSKNIKDPVNFTKACDLLNEFVDRVSDILSEITHISDLINLVVVMCIRERVSLLCAKDKVIYSNDVLTKLDEVLNGSQGGDHLAKLLRDRYKVAMIDEFQDTDPVQFSIFKKLYLTKESIKSSSVVYLIGDPKQSIYEFRGSDINSYLKAKTIISTLTQNSSNIKTLNTNYRSTPALIKSVNDIFLDNIRQKDAQVSKVNTFIVDNITYEKVNFVNKPVALVDRDDNDTCLDGTTITSIVDDSNKARKLKYDCARRASLDILHLLKHAYIKHANGSYKKVKPSDIAVLVSSGSENEIIAKELLNINIPSVYYSDSESVLLNKDGDSPSADALNIIFLMQAMIEPTVRSYLNRLLGSRLLGFDTDEFVQAKSEESYEREIEILNECRSIWEKDGFLSAFSYYYLDKRHRCLNRRLQEIQGQRRISNLYQIAELIQKLHNKIIGVNAQLRYFLELINNKEGSLKLDDTTFEKRLDSEREQVKVLTIHKSKGLEFPIVIMPFIWVEAQRRDFGNARLIPYFDEKYQSYVIGFDEKKSKELRALSSNQERRRLLYVALTRAKFANYIYAVDTDNTRQYNISPINSILAGPISPEYQKSTTKTAIANLKNFTQKDSANIHLCEVVARSDDRSLLKDGECDIEPLLNDHEIESDFALSLFDENTMDRRFVFTSYSGITLDASKCDDYKNYLELKNDEAVGLQDEANEIALDLMQKSDVLNLDLLNFDLREQNNGLFNSDNYPKGAIFGTIIHNIFEKTAFERVKCNGGLEQSVSDYLVREGDLKLKALKQKWLFAVNGVGQDDYLSNAIDALVTWFKGVCLQNLLVGCGKNYSLSDLKKGDYIPEMQFLMPCHDFDIVKFNSLCKKEALRVFKDLKDKSLIDEMFLNKSIIDGFLNGSLDLVLRFKEDDSYKYYVLDYKSNYLGPMLDDYASMKIAQNMFSQSHRYDVQYLLYSVVLHRYLKLRVKDYDFNKHFGGVLYLFVRGMGHDDNHGVFYTKPDLKLIEELEALLY